ncbi:M28 family metallopeptidase [Streptomyces alkaliterrae]|uniref:M28 family peptidase n=2 Tax=Streptomyces alkaliterrae TaxID=2213162 RepID=A0A5P0YXY0_9ACTN|nr:M28 family metallopeptidase [Streptomyces alkaliterrae]MQS04447.1 M28 family peptidase [Streptomyces alkaliterrae]
MHAPQKRRRRTTAALAVAALATPLIIATTASPAVAKGKPSEGEKLAAQLVKKTGQANGMKHLRVFQSIAMAHDKNRAAGSRGHELSARYAGTLLKAAGYKVTYQDFDFVYRETVAEKLKVLSPEERDVAIKLMTYTKSTPKGGVEAEVAEVPRHPEGLTGCSADDFAPEDFTGKVALIQRGGCTFADKQANAAKAGAVGAVIYNNTAGELNGTLGDADAAKIPTGGISKEHGDALSAEVAKGTVKVNLELIEFQETRTTPNVIAETPTGDKNNVVMVGAHLDSVTDGPGINDNASGSAGVLETALQYAKATKLNHHKPHKKQPKNQVRFALWTAEEIGLQGSEHYVENLSEKERENIALYLNFDMIASPNYGLFVYDGDDSDGEGAGPGPDGSAQIEYKINKFIKSRGEQPRGTDFSGRSDYGPFIAVGIPSGGTFTGAEGVKTEEQAKLWGGKAGVAYDECYHQACDDINNVDKKAFDINMKVIAHTVGHYAWDTGSLQDEVPFAPTSGGTGSGGGLHEHHDHDEPDAK